MSDPEVRIVHLEPMRVVSVRAVGESPEEAAWEKMRAWAEPRGLLDDFKAHAVFGFNNPAPVPDNKEYGYEFWIKVDADTRAEDEIEIRDFNGGLYAVITCEVKGNPWETIPAAWRKLADWVSLSQYDFGAHQELESPHDPMASPEELVLDLYCPLKEA